MAEAPDRIDKRLEELEGEITCAVCQDHYQEARLLPCNHYYCRACIEELAKRSRGRPFPCPECRKDASLPPGGTEQLQSAFFVERLKDLYGRMAKAEGKMEAACEMCPAGKAVAFCRHCVHFLCSDCTRSHQRMTMFAGHSVSTLEDLKRRGAQDIPMKETPPPKCPEHDDQIMTIFCFDCNCLICRDCTVIDHNGHKFNFLKKCATKSRKSLRDSLAPLHMVQVSITDADRKLVATETQVDAQKKEVCQIIKRSFAQLKAILEQRETELLNNALTLAQEKKNALTAQRKGLQMAETEIQSLMEFVQKNVENTSDKDLMVIHTQLLARVEEEEKRHRLLSLEPATTADITFCPTSPDIIPRDLGEVVAMASTAAVVPEPASADDSAIKKMDKIVALEQQLKKAQQQWMTYEKQVIKHGGEISRLQGLLQKEQKRAAVLESQVDAMSQHLQQEERFKETKSTKAEEMHKEFASVSQKMGNIAELEKKLEEEHQKRLIYEKRNISHGSEIGRLHSLLQAEKQQAALLQRHAAELSRFLEREMENNSKRCPRQASECNKILKRETGKAEKQRNEDLQSKVRAFQDMNAKLSERIQQLQRILESPECQKPRCVQLEQKIREQQRVLQMVSPMEDMARQYDGQHDQLTREYDELMTNPDGILGQLEKEFADPFDAEVALGGIFMAGYEESKNYVIEFVAENLKELFKVQTEPDEDRVVMDDLSHAFGLLLHSTAVKSRLTCSTVIPIICDKVKQKIPRLKPCRKAQKMISDAPVKQVVELAWKFVTLPNPMIVCQPETFSPDIHNKAVTLWSIRSKPYQLKYVRPVVYRSYHGLVACKGLVGNEPVDA